MRVRITKAQAIEAIRTEPLLRPGAWTYFPDDAANRNNNAIGDDANCLVCAVGAVMRDLVDPKVSANQVDRVVTNTTYGYSIDLGDNPMRTSGGVSLEDSARVLLNLGKVWNALSVLFEGYCAKEGLPRRHKNIDLAGLERVRARLIAFVTAEFPDDWEIDLDRVPYRPGAAKEVTP
jgi:hypothetical protein